MNKAFEKILERLILESSSCKVYKNIKPNIEDVAEFNAYKKCIEIVKEVAEEYNNGWIPCSEMLPSGLDFVLYTHKDGDVDTCSIEYFYDYLDRITAWQPLPEPFKENDYDD